VIAGAAALREDRMSRHLRRLALAMAGIALAVSSSLAGSTGSSSAAQSSRPPGTTWSPPRTPWGDPDLQGMYRREGISQLSIERRQVPAVGVGRGPYPAAFTQDGQQPPPLHPEALAAVRDRRLGVVDPPDGNLPWQPWALARREEMWKHIHDMPTIDNIDPHILCMPPGVPRSGAGGYHFVQAPGLVVLVYEFNHIARRIPLDGRPHVGRDIKLFMGDSRGRWEGSTLVVETTNFTDRTWFDMVATFHSDALHVVERFTPADPDTIEYEATFTDPKVFTRPWKVAGVLLRAVADYEPYEYACAEGNRNLENVIRPPGR
jgi:hypothetical protein